MTSLTLNYLPFDRHAHARNRTRGIMDAVVPVAEKNFWGAVWMPNTQPFITTPDIAQEYRAALEAVSGPDFVHVVTGYLQENMSPEMIAQGFVDGSWSAMKAYPRGGTTNSHGGIENWYALSPQLAVMERIGMPLLVHGELNYDWKHEREEDPHERERRFMDSVLPWILQTFPELVVSLEHITTRDAAAIIKHHGSRRLRATVTPQHLLFSKIDFFSAGPQWQMHMWPTYKGYDDFEAVRALVASGSPWVGAGTDTAPHPHENKIDSCGCPGGFFSRNPIALYAEAFEQMGALMHLENFLCINGLDIFGLKPKVGTLVLSNEGDPYTIDFLVPIEGDYIHPFGYHPDQKKRRAFRWRSM